MVWMTPAGYPVEWNFCGWQHYLWFDGEVNTGRALLSGAVF